MNDVLLKLVDSDYIVPVCGVVMGSLIAIVAIVATSWHRVRHAEMEAALKQQMLSQGMSAADIKMVLEAGSGRGRLVRGAGPKQPISGSHA